MTPPRLLKLTIAHLRGSVEVFELPFDKGRNLTVIYGENGTGKSTICDALELLGKGHIASLDNRGLGATKQYWSTVGKKAADIAVTLETSVGSCRASFGKSDVVVHPPEAQPRVEVLRRSQILGLVEARAADRYSAIRRFIDVSGVEESETTLRKLITDLNKSRDIAAARILENSQAIQQFWQVAGGSNTNAIDWARAEVARATPGRADPELAALQSLQFAYGRLLPYPAQLAEREQAMQQAQVAVNIAQQQATAYLQTVASDASEIIGVLEAARGYLAKHAQPAACPLCQSSAAAQGLAERIDQRLAAFATLQRVRGAQQQAASQVQRSEQQLAVLRDQAANDISDFTQAINSFAWSPDVPMPIAALPLAIESLAGWLELTANLPTLWQQAEATRQDRRQFVATLQSALETFDENMLGQQELDTLLPNLQRALEITEEERKRFTDGVLGKIANEVGRMYEAVHPGEGLNKIKLELNQSRRASMDIGTTFGGKDGLPPQAYFSQSHLDTLGLCVFLALAALEQPEDTILILDDVLASVDEPHVDRVIALLYDEVAKFRHCIVTTHYGPWRHKLRKSADNNAFLRSCILID